MKRRYRKVVAYVVAFSFLLETGTIAYASDNDNNFVETAIEMDKEIWKGSIEGGNLVYLDENGEKSVGLKEIQGKTYYFDLEGIVQTGWQVVEDKTYYFSVTTGERYENCTEMIEGKEYIFNSEGMPVVIEKNENVTESIDEDITRIESGWVETEEGKIFINASGERVYGIQNIENKLYYFNELGILQKYWIDYNGNRYFADINGVLYQNQFISFGSIRYYMGEDGAVQKGIVENGGKLYYANEETGIIETTAGWLEVNNKRYFIAAGGVLYQNQFISFGSIRYYMGEDGAVQKGIVESGGKLYYANEESGIIETTAGWLEVNNKRYFIAAGGILYRNQIITFGDIGYCMGADGSVQFGSVTLNGVTYYTDEITGIIQKRTGWIEKNGKKYFANAEGILYRNQIITFGDVWYCMGADGSVQYGIGEVAGKLYHTDEQTGVVIKSAGWFEKGDNRYFANAQGVLYQNQFISFGTIYYYCGANGAICSGNQVINGVKYQFDENGIMIKESGWGENEGKKYYKNPATGFPYKNQWVTFGQTWYYADINGLMVSGWHEINGARYYFYPETFVMARNVSIDGWEIGSDGKAGSTQYLKKKINEIKKYVSVPYQTGGTTPLGWDCSGFTMWALKYLGVNIPRLSFEQAVCGTAIDKNDMSKWKPGDILVYSSGGYAGHVALYLGDGMLMHALNYRWGTLIQGVEYYENWDSGTTLTGVRRYL